MGSWIPELLLVFVAVSSSGQDLGQSVSTAARWMQEARGARFQGDEAEFERLRAGACEQLERAFRMFPGDEVRQAWNGHSIRAIPSESDCATWVGATSDDSLPAGERDGHARVYVTGGSAPVGGTQALYFSVLGLPDSGQLQNFTLRLIPEGSNPPGFSLVATEIPVFSLGTRELRTLAAVVSVDGATPVGSVARYRVELHNDSTGAAAWVGGEGLVEVMAMGANGGGVTGVDVDPLTPQVSVANDETATLSWRLSNRTASEQTVLVEVGPAIDPLAGSVESGAFIGFFLEPSATLTPHAPLADTPEGARVYEVTIPASGKPQLDFTFRGGRFARNGHFSECFFRIRNSSGAGSALSVPQFILDTTPVEAISMRQSLSFYGEATGFGTFDLVVGEATFPMSVVPGQLAVEVAAEAVAKINAHAGRFDGTFPVNAFFNFNEVLLTGVGDEDVELTFGTGMPPGLQLGGSGHFNEMQIENVEVNFVGSGLFEVEVRARMEPGTKVEAVPLRVTVDGARYVDDQVLAKADIGVEVETTAFMKFHLPMPSVNPEVTAWIDPEGLHEEGNSQVPDNRLTVRPQIAGFHPLVLPQPGQSALTLEGPAELEVHVERSTDLRTWLETAASPASFNGAGMLMLDDDASALDLAFYRARPVRPLFPVHLSVAPGAGIIRQFVVEGDPAIVSQVQEILPTPSQLPTFIGFQVDWFSEAGEGQLLIQYTVAGGFDAPPGVYSIEIQLVALDVARKPLPLTIPDLRKHVQVNP